MLEGAAFPEEYNEIGIMLNTDLTPGAKAVDKWWKKYSDPRNGYTII